jgi:glutathione synthase/RimK-type ligase-like ATP-grasp enzyme
VNPYTLNVNKQVILEHVPEPFRPFSNYLANVNIHDLPYPVIVKPLTCAKEGIGVTIISTVDDMINFQKNHDTKKYLVQEYLYYLPRDIAILYENGDVVFAVEKEYPGSIRNLCSPCVNKPHLLTPELIKSVRYISKSIPGFNVGRYDIRFASRILGKALILKLWKPMAPLVMTYDLMKRMLPIYS